MLLYVPYIVKVCNLVNPFSNRYSSAVPNSQYDESEKER